MNTNDKTTKSPPKQSSDIDNDEFFSQLTKPQLIPPSFASKSPEKATTLLNNDPWSATSTHTIANSNNGIKNDINSQTKNVNDDLWLTKPSLSVDLADPWAEKPAASLHPKLPSAIVPSANNPWSNESNNKNTPLINNDPWAVKQTVPSLSQPTSNASLWPSLNDIKSNPTPSSTNLLTNNLINNLWPTASSNTTPNMVSAFSAPIMHSNSNTAVNNPFMTNSLFPATNNNFVSNSTPNYAVLSQPWLTSSSYNTSNTITNSNKTTNPFID